LTLYINLLVVPIFVKLCVTCFIFFQICFPRSVHAYDLQDCALPSSLAYSSSYPIRIIIFPDAVYVPVAEACSGYVIELSRTYERKLSNVAERRRTHPVFIKAAHPFSHLFIAALSLLVLSYPQYFLPILNNVFIKSYRNRFGHHLLVRCFTVTSVVLILTRVFTVASVSGKTIALKSSLMTRVTGLPPHMCRSPTVSVSLEMPQRIRSQ
jgi:hypothetical protein